MAIRLFLEYEKQVVQFPVNPEELELTRDTENETTQIVNLGEINLINAPNLKEVEFECFFPSDSLPPYVVTKGKFKKPQFYIDFIEKIMNDKKPARFIVSDTKINFEVSIEEFEYSLNAGTNDINYTLNLKEYKPFSAKTVIIKQPTAATKPKASTSTKKRTPKAFAIGDVVICNGKYWYSSWGAKPFGTFKNFKGKIHLIVADKTRKYRYHITTMTGGWRGWVDESQIRHE